MFLLQLFINFDFLNTLGLSAKDNAVPKLTEAMSRIAAVSADVQASLNEIKDILDSEEEQQNEYEEIIGKRPAPIALDLMREYGKYKDAHSMALDSNATLHKAIQLHLNNLKKLSTPLDELQTSIPSMADIDEESEASITQVSVIFQFSKHWILLYIVCCEKKCTI